MAAHALSIDAFAHWLRAYQAAWEGRDAKAAGKLFSDDAEYYWTPLVPPHRGPAGIAAAWEAAVSGQRDVRFTYDVFAVSESSGMATWRADFVQLPAGHQVRIEGVLCAELDAAGRCRRFREWWHSTAT